MLRRVIRDDVALVTESFGKVGDPAVLLVMGATASMLHWPEELCADLAARGLFVIRFDHRDTGGSTTWPPGDAPYAVEDMAQDAVAVLDDWGIGAVHLVGMSLGGFIAQMVAVTHPDRVLSLTLLGSEPLGWDGAALPGLSDRFMDHFAAFGSLDWTDRAAVTAFMVESERLCAGSAVPFDAAREAARAGRVLDRTESPASMFNHGALVTREDWTGRFREIACPVVVIHGAEDPILPVENGRALAEGIAGAELVVLPGIGHELPLPILPGIAARIAGLAAR
jgi:pimeloyl-ACP methyl ester carboxylesterase